MTGFCGVVDRMAETAQLIELLQKQMEEQWKQMEEGRKQTEALIAAFMGQMGQGPRATFSKGTVSGHSQLRSVRSYDRIVGHHDCWARFQTFVGANSVSAVGHSNSPRRYHLYFPAIRDLLDEAMRICFMCSVSNEAVLKYKEEELTFAKAIAVAMETEEAAKVAKETVYGTKVLRSQSKRSHRI